ncbi:hypothetical protein I0E98_04635 [Pseudomonas lalucatii]|nr:hypothetical protein [Pseudomonas lalucatii]
MLGQLGEASFDTGSHCAEHRLVGYPNTAAEIWAGRPLAVQRHPSDIVVEPVEQAQRLRHLGQCAVAFARGCFQPDIRRDAPGQPS